MPTFELVSIEDAIKDTAITNKRQEVLKGYLEYIEQLEEGLAGCLEATEVETLGAVRRRLGAAARLAGRELVIKRRGQEIYFWLDSRKKTRRKRGRRPKDTDSTSE